MLMEKDEEVTLSLTAVVPIPKMFSITLDKRALTDTIRGWI